MLFQTATSGGSCSRSGWCTGDRICPPPVTLSTCSCLSAAASARHSRSSAAPLARFWSNSDDLLSHSPQCFLLLLHCTSVFYSFCFDNLPGAVHSSSRILFFVHHSIMLFEMAKLNVFVLNFKQNKKQVSWISAQLWSVRPLNSGKTAC